MASSIVIEMMSPAVKAFGTVIVTSDCQHQ